MHGFPLSLSWHGIFAWTKVLMSLFFFQTLFLSCEQLHHIFLCSIGRALCDGWEANLYEAPARQPLHAGSGLFKDLFIRAMPLHSVRFWMVMTSPLRFLSWDYTVRILSSVILYFFHYLFTRKPLFFEHLNSIALNYSCLYRFVIRNRCISLQNFICLNIHLTLHIYWITNMTVFIESNYSFEIVDGSWEVFIVLL